VQFAIFGRQSTFSADLICRAKMVGFPVFIAEGVMAKSHRTPSFLKLIF
jgi:hypothetical protein